MVYALTFENFPKGDGQYLYVQQQRPIVNVPNIKSELIFPRDVVASVDLRPTGDTGKDSMAASLGRGVAIQILGEQRARANEAHFAPQYVIEFGKLVKAGSAQETA